MTFLAPGFFIASLAAAAAVIALHFIVTRQPRAAILPTARFVPDVPANATARATRPSDLLLMLLRALLILVAGAGLAKPILKPSRGAEARVILMDVSASVSDSSALRDSVRALYRNHDALIVFDSSARAVAGDVADSIASASFTGARGNISAALIAAMRSASSLRDRADSIELVVVSPFAAREFDAATDSIRALWKGRARIVAVRGTVADTTRPASPLEIRAVTGDPLAIAVARARPGSRANGFIVRSSAFDSAIADGRPVIVWPANERPLRAVARSAADTIGGVVSGEALVVSQFERRWSFPQDSIRGAQVVARWIDGEPAAIESETQAGCERSVAIPVSPAGDLVIRNDFVHLVAALSSECSARAALRPADPARVEQLGGNGALASRDAFRPRGDLRSGLAPWLIGFAMSLAVLELFIRRRRTADLLSMRSAASSERRAA
jgi:hypothetical protein